MTRVAAAAALIAGGGLLWAADVLRELGVDETQAQQTVGSVLRGGTVSVYPARTVLEAASPAERARLVQEALAWAKADTGSTRAPQSP